MASVTRDEVVAELQGLAEPRNVEGMAHYGIVVDRALGISICTLRPMAKRIGRDHDLALQLWETGIHEARLLAVFLDDPAQVSAAQMESWAADFDSWDVCDQACTSLFDASPAAWNKAVEWAARDEQFVKRGGFAIMAGLAVHDKASADERFIELLTAVEQQADDGRNFVKKAASWALRNIGKRNVCLHAAAIETAQAIAARGTRSARWIAGDALRELRSEKILRRLGIAAGDVEGGG